MLKIVGAKGIVKDVDDFLKKVNNFSQKNSIISQVFNADMIYGEKHIISAVDHAKRSFDRKKNTTNSLDMEILLYTSGERQLKLAIPKMGIKKGSANILFVFIKDKKIHNETINVLLKQLSLKHDNSVIEGNEITLKNFGITNIEKETVTKDKYSNLILEKVAMVDILK